MYNIVIFCKIFIVILLRLVFFIDLFIYEMYILYIDGLYNVIYLDELYN